MAVLINLNDKVRVRITETGWCGVTPLTRSLHPEDAQGYSEWELWGLMHEFGPQMYNGNPSPPIENMRLYFPQAPTRRCGNCRGTGRVVETNVCRQCEGTGRIEA